MEPNQNSFNGSAELPQPQELTPSQQGEALPAAAPETQHGPAQPPLAPIQASAPVAPVGILPTQPVPSVGSSNPQAGMGHLIADDADLIEKEWVIKAKAIVAQTKDDPHQQNQEMTKVKADYLKKRYNKDLKVSEG